MHQASKWRVQSHSPGRGYEARGGSFRRRRLACGPQLAVPRHSLVSLTLAFDPVLRIITAAGQLLHDKIRTAQGARSILWEKLDNLPDFELVHWRREPRFLARSRVAVSRLGEQVRDCYTCAALATAIEAETAQTILRLREREPDR